MSDTVYVVRDASGEYVGVNGRTPASNEAMEFANHDDAADACERATDRVLAREADDSEDGLVRGSQVQVDRSGVGHCWVNVAADEIPANIREEIEGEMIDGGQESCDDYRASNGLHYRW